VGVPSEEPERWVPALREFLDGIDRYQPPSAPQYHRRALTSRLAALLDLAKGAR
jgi:hypothetical protein